jgi:hypothetical protein
MIAPAVGGRNKHNPRAGPQLWLYDLVLTSVGPTVESATRILAEACGESPRRNPAVARVHA